MTETYALIAAVCGAGALILAGVCLAVLLVRTRRRDESAIASDLSRLEQLILRANDTAAQSAHNVRDWLEFISKRQSGDLQAVAARLEALNTATERRLTELERAVAGEVRYMNEQNAAALAEMRKTVDEKLSSTLENRLQKSYSLINERLEAVYKGIGEVQQLAGSVADIKKVFTNVKLRGTWGEVQLEALLAQMLSPAQYRANVHLDPNENTVVEYAVLLPAGEGESALLPIDSKFPAEEYRRLADAEAAGDKAAAERARKNLEKALKVQADMIAQKYIRPPLTADIAVMFLPLEGLYGESIKMPGLADYLAERRVVACGPTTLGALLTTLQLGYKTAAIQKRSGELWALLSAFRREFKNFALILDKAQKKMQEAQDTIESAARKTRTIGRKLRAVEGDALPAGEEAKAGIDAGEEDAGAEGAALSGRDTPAGGEEM